MSRGMRIVIVALVALAAIGVTLIGRDAGQKEGPGTATETATALPRLVDLGSTTCIPCKRMAPILDELKTEYADRFVVEVIDVRERPEASDEYGIRLIPTQIFYDAEGNELWRHEGFIDKASILARWRELGFSFATTESAS